MASDPASDVSSSPGDTKPTLSSLLAQSVELQRTLPPLYTWEALCTIIDSCELSLLRRHPTLEALYISHFVPLVKQEWGTVEQYLKAQLIWTTEYTEEYWERSMESLVRRNDWGYALPRDVEHWVIWIPLPLVHPTVCVPPGPPWEDVSVKGVCGFTGLSPGDASRYLGYGAGSMGPGKEAEGFILGYWEEVLWSTVWFWNPPSLQSVKGLAHFHVFAKKKCT